MHVEDAGRIFTENWTDSGEFALVDVRDALNLDPMTDVAVISLSILVADDEPGIRDLLVEYLQNRGHTVAAAGSASEASRVLRTEPFDLVITDIVMPDGDGFELISALRASQPSTRVLAISGGGKFLHGPECLKMARGLGAHAVLMKPFTWQQLMAAIDSALLEGESAVA